MHRKFITRCEDLMMQRQSTQTSFDKHSEHGEAKYKTQNIQRGKGFFNLL